MKIDRHNFYELAFKYFEGDLSSELNAEFMSFIAENQEFEYEFEQIKKTYLNPEEIDIVPDFNSLKKSYSDVNISDNTIDELCIAYLERDLDSETRKKLEQAIEINPYYKKTFDLYNKISIKPDLTITFPSKSELKKYTPVKKENRIRRLVITVSAAAVLLLIAIGINIFRNNTEKQPVENPVIAEKNNIINPPELKDNKNPSIYQAPVYSQVTYSKNTVSEIPEKDENILLEPMTSIRVRQLTSPDIEISMKSSHYQGDNIVVINNNSATKDRLPQIRNLSSQEVDLLAAIQFGIKGINELTESDLELMADKNEQGRINKITLNADNFQFSRSLRKK